MAESVDRERAARHDSAASSHDAAAQRHEEAARLWERHGRADEATFERRNARIERDAAELERDRARFHRGAGFVSLSVMLIVADARAAAAWYREALGATELWSLGSVAGLEVQGAPFFLHEAVPGRAGENSPSEAGLTTTRIELFADDPDALVEAAAAAGATDVAAARDHEVPWGVHRQGGFTDPFGHRWSVGDRTPLGRH